MYELKQQIGSRIVAAMKRLALLSLLLALTAIPAAAQSSSFGILVGGSENTSDGWDLDPSNPVRELFYGVELENDTWFKIKAGQVDSDDGPRFGAPGVEREGKVEYIDAIVEYNFSESFGRTGLFAGPGFYRQRFGSLEESDWGFAFGVSGTFPITRRFAFLAELGYHVVNFEEEYNFLNIMGGLRIAF